MSTDTSNPPEEREDTSRLGGEFVRAVYEGGAEIVRSDEAGIMPTLRGHFSVFGEWAEISSLREGHFLERFDQGAFAKTFRESRDRIRVLFQHGLDPQIGNKPLGPLVELREDERGAYYEVPLLDTAYNRELLPGLEAGLYGASMRFEVMRETRDRNPKPSLHNPDGLPERTVKEARVREFGPVTFPAYAGATAGVRSMTDLLIDVEAVAIATPILLDEERLTRAREFLTRPIPVVDNTPPDDEERSTAPPSSSAETPESHPARGRRVSSLYGQKEAVQWRL